MSINHFITKAMAAINFPALYKIDVQWSKLHVGVWATWDVDGSNHKSGVYGLLPRNVAQGWRLSCKSRTVYVGHLLGGPDYEVDTKSNHLLSGIPLQRDSLEKRMHLRVVYGRHFSKTTSCARWIEQSEWSLTCSSSFIVNCTQQTLTNESSFRRSTGYTDGEYKLEILIIVLKFTT